MRENVNKKSIIMTEEFDFRGDTRKQTDTERIFNGIKNS